MMLESLSPLGNAFAESTVMTGITLVDARERSDLGAVLLSASVAGHEVADSLGSAISCTLPLNHGLTTQANGKRAIWMSPRSWILLCAPADEDQLIKAVVQEFPDYSVHATRFSDALGWLSLEGDAAEDLIRQGSFVTLDAAGMPVDHAKRTLLAGISAVILRESGTLWTIGVERSRSPYLMDWLSGLTQSVGDNP